MISRAICWGGSRPGRTRGQTTMAGQVRENIFVGTDIRTVVDLPGDLSLTVRTSNSARGAQGIFEPGAQVSVHMEEGAGRLLID